MGFVMFESNVVLELDIINTKIKNHFLKTGHKPKCIIRKLKRTPFVKQIVAVLILES